MSYEQFHTELVKALVVILRRVTDSERLLACLGPQERYYRSILAFLREFADKAVDTQLREWCSYCLTMLCLRISDYASGRLMRNPGGRVETTTPIRELLAEADASARWLLPLILEQDHDLACKELLRETVANLVRFFESWEG